MIDRRVTKDYRVDEVNCTLAKGTLVIISVYAIHHDPEYYPKPEEFNPDRFTPEEIKKRPTCSWLPFGDGPRNCIGLRFGMLQARVGLVTLLRSFEFSPSDRTEVPLRFSIKNIVLSPVGGMMLNVKSIA